MKFATERPFANPRSNHPRSDEMKTEQPTVIELSNEELDVVAGGDRSTKVTKNTKGTKGTTDDYLTVTMTEVSISG
jgi:hypothetical protein